MSGNKTGQYDTVTVVFQSFEVYCYVCWTLVVVNVWRLQVITRKCRYVNLCALVLLHCYAKLRRPTVDSWCCRMTNYELLRWLVETPSRDFEHYRMTDDSWQSIIRHFHVRWKCRMIDSLDGVSTYSSADVLCYSATCRTGLNERNSVRQIVDRSYK